jgi:hypothetical protein
LAMHKLLGEMATGIGLVLLAGVLPGVVLLLRSGKRRGAAAANLGAE